MARVNWALSKKLFRDVYLRVGQVISVCEEDRQYTLALAPQAQVQVIENGVDCAYYAPNRHEPWDNAPRLLFTGTSAARNMIALRHLVRDILPLIEQQDPSAELWVGGNFSAEAQAEFHNRKNIHFTGPVDDIRPVFNASDVFVAPFAETHGSKLKVAEAMAMQMAIISTPQGIRGFPLEHGKSVLVAHDDQQFAAHCVALLHDPLKRKLLGEAARKQAVESVDWNVLGNRVRAIVESVRRAMPAS